MQKRISELHDEEQSIIARQKILKTILYGRFGNTINLEDKP